MDENDIPNLNNLEHDLMNSLGGDAETRRQKKKYDTGVAVGIAVIILSAAAFVYMMFVMPDNLSAGYLAGCAASIVLMIASIIVVSVRVKRLQDNYFAQAGNAAEEYTQELINKLKNKQKLNSSDR